MNKEVMALPKKFIRYPDKGFEVGLAKDDMGPELGAFLAECGMDFCGHALEWGRAYPYWVVAIGDDGDLWGALNIAYSLPVGRLEALSYKRDLDKKIRIQIINELVVLGMAALASSGSELVACTIKGSDTVFLDWCERRGAQTLTRDGHVLLMRIPDGSVQ